MYIVSDDELSDKEDVIFERARVKPDTRSYPHLSDNEEEFSVDCLILKFKSILYLEL